MVGAINVELLDSNLVRGPFLRRHCRRLGRTLRFDWCIWILSYLCRGIWKFFCGRKKIRYGCGRVRETKTWPALLYAMTVRGRSGRLVTERCWVVADCAWRRLAVYKRLAMVRHYRQKFGCRKEQSVGGLENNSETCALLLALSILAAKAHATWLVRSSTRAEHSTE